MKTAESNVHCGFNIESLELIGEGHQGRVYLLEDDKVLKVFKTRHAAAEQQMILKHCCDSRFFPKIYEVDKRSIIMELIKGQPITIYLNNAKITKKISFELVDLIREFQKLGFTRLDMRLAHIFVQANQSIRVIDPRKTFEYIQPFPLSMLKGLEKQQAIEDFFNFIKGQYNMEYRIWKELWEEYKLK